MLNSASSQEEKHFKRKEKILGQFYTPKALANFIVKSCAKLVHERNLLIDPACGDGVFLEVGISAGFKEVIGIDIDSTIIKHTKSALKDKIVVANGLEITGYEEKCDAVVGNPPFSAKYGRITDRKLLNKFSLGRRKSSQAIEVLFLEKFVQLAKEGGIIGIILPFGIFANTQLAYIRRFMFKNLKILAVISLPRGIFPKTTAKTCILLAMKNNEGHSGPILFAKVGKLRELEHLERRGKFVDVENNILYPEYYLDRIEIRAERRLEDVVTIRSGATEYGDARFFVKEGIPFISAKVITPLGIDFSRERKFIKPNSIMDKESARVNIGDVLFVRVGVGCIGRVAVVTNEAEKGIADDWIYIMRVKNEQISPYYIAFYMQTDIIQKEIRRLARGVGTTTIPKRLLYKIPFFWDEKLNAEAEKIYLRMVELRKSGRIREAERVRKEFKSRIEALIASESARAGNAERESEGGDGGSSA